MSNKPKFITSSSMNNFAQFISDEPNIEPERSLTEAITAPKKSNGKYGTFNGIARKKVR